MAAFHPHRNELDLKIVYYGPGLSGKTVSLEQVFARVRPRARGRAVYLASERNRALYFDYLPLSLGRIQGHNTRLSLYSVPGQKPFETSRRLILKGADGIVFVADSHLERLETNLESMVDLRSNLIKLGIDPGRIPMVMQFNKRDIPHAATAERMSALINPDRYPEFLSVATRGEGVFEALKEITGMVLGKAKRRPRGVRRRVA